MDTPKPAMAAAVTILKGLPVPVATEVRKESPTQQNPPQYVRVSRVGGGMSNLVTDRATILVECFADNGVAAETLANQARGLLFQSRGKVFAGCFIRWYTETQGPVDFPDEGKARYQFMGDLLVGTQ